MIETRRRIGRCVVSAVLLCACSAAGCTGGRALQGDFEAALIVLRIAEAQRQQAGS